MSSSTTALSTTIRGAILFLASRDHLRENLAILIDKLAIKCVIEFDHEAREAKKATQERFNDARNSQSSADRHSQQPVDRAMVNVLKHRGDERERLFNLVVLEQFQSQLMYKTWTPLWFERHMFDVWSEEEKRSLPKLLRDTVLLHRRMIFLTKDVLPEDEDSLSSGKKLLARFLCRTLELVRDRFLHQLGLFDPLADTAQSTHNRAEQMSIVTEALRSALRYTSGAVEEACELQFSPLPLLSGDGHDFNEENERDAMASVAATAAATALANVVHRGPSQEDVAEKEADEQSWKHNLLIATQQQSRGLSNLQRPVDLIRGTVDEILSVMREYAERPVQATVSAPEPMMRHRDRRFGRHVDEDGDDEAAIQMPHATTLQHQRQVEDTLLRLMQQAAASHALQTQQNQHLDKIATEAARTNDLLTSQLAYMRQLVTAAHEAKAVQPVVAAPVAPAPAIQNYAAPIMGVVPAAVAAWPPKVVTPADDLQAQPASPRPLSAPVQAPAAGAVEWDALLRNVQQAMPPFASQQREGEPDN